MEYIQQFEKYKKIQNNVVLTIINKRIINKTPKSYQVVTSSYGSGNMFFIPKSQVLSTKESSIKYNDVYAEPATEFTITKFIYDKLKENFDKMSNLDFILNK